PGVKFCAGEGGLRSWEWCGGGGVECRVGKGGEWGWREKLLKGMNSWGEWERVVGLMGEWLEVAGVGGSGVETFGGKNG
nr:hypothetical protein [Tanacetum cinerariifolium]